MAHKILMIIAPDQFRDEELLVPRKAFQAQGWTVDTMSTRIGEARGMLGAVESVAHDLPYAEAEAKNQGYDAVIVVGGMGSVEYLWDNTQLHRILQTISRQERVVASICLSGAVLANAGLLRGKRATVWEMPESLEAMKVGGCTYTGEPLTVDSNIVTANGPDAAQQFAQAVIERVQALIPA
ncbi:MAG TPA: DJ-1/PfpI family protein [Coleofasciculaceae cyanobacterium]|jgi:protease I